jgi:hypothetical protein
MPFIVRNEREAHPFESLNAAYEFIYVHRLVKHGKWEVLDEEGELIREIDEPEIPVIFRKWRGKGGSVIAVMPTLPSDVQNWYNCNSYMHHGQHGGCDYACAVMPNTKLATEEEYRDLKAELERYPYFYNFKMYQRETPQMRQERELTWKRMMLDE